MRMTTDEEEINQATLTSLRSAHAMFKAALIGAQSDLDLWEERHLEGLRRCEEINLKFEAREKQE